MPCQSRRFLVESGDELLAASAADQEIAGSGGVDARNPQHWQLDFPGDDLEAMRAFCTEVDHRVQALIADLHPPSR
jgi:hypothetical protein